MLVAALGVEEQDNSSSSLARFNVQFELFE